jgi:hypothetical protein
MDSFEIVKEQGGNVMAASSMKEKIFQFSMIALIIGGFAILLSVLCLHDWKIYPSKPIPSLLLFFR